MIYRVDQRAGGESTTRWEDLAVQRPFRSRLVSYTERPPTAAAPISGTVASIDQLYTYSSGALVHVSGRQPAPGTGDQSLGVVLAEAVRRGVARVRTVTRRIAGRTCHDVRLAEPPAGPLAPLGTKDGFDDLCIDADGIVLRESWTLQGRVVQVRTAVRVDPVGGDVDALLATDGATEVPGAAVVAPRTMPVEGPRPDEPRPPDGFTLATAVSFVFPDPQQPEAVGYASTVWAFTRGGDVVTVERGTSPQGNRPWSSLPADRDATLGGKPARSVVRSDGYEVHAAIGEKDWIRVRGTIAPRLVESYARNVDADAGD